jgi:hypothetical protein
MVTRERTAVSVRDCERESESRVDETSSPVRERSGGRNEGGEFADALHHAPEDGADDDVGAVKRSKGLIEQGRKGGRGGIGAKGGKGEAKENEQKDAQKETSGTGLGVGSTSSDEETSTCERKRQERGQEGKERDERRSARRRLRAKRTRKRRTDTSRETDYSAPTATQGEGGEEERNKVSNFLLKSLSTRSNGAVQSSTACTTPHEAVKGRTEGDMPRTQTPLEVSMSSHSEFRRREVSLKDALVRLLKVELVVGLLETTGGGRVGGGKVGCRVKVVLVLLRHRWRWLKLSAERRREPNKGRPKLGAQGKVEAKEAKESFKRRPAGRQRREHDMRDDWRRIDLDSKEREKVRARGRRKRRKRGEKGGVPLRFASRDHRGALLRQMATYCRRERCSALPPRERKDETVGEVRFPLCGSFSRSFSVARCTVGAERRLRRPWPASRRAEAVVGAREQREVHGRGEEEDGLESDRYCYEESQRTAKRE